MLPSSDACAPLPPPTYATDPASEFYALALEVYCTNLAIMGHIARNDGLSLIVAAEGYIRVGIAAANAFIGCWQTKYTYNVLRPITYIQAVIDADWLPLLVTPPFPEYPSGHATQSGAVATVLTDLFGVKVFTDTTHSDHGLMPPQPPRTFSSFDEAAAEAARFPLDDELIMP